MTEFFATHFTFLADAYSFVYGHLNGLMLRLLDDGKVLLIYLAIETVIPKSRNSFASTARSSLYVVANLAVNSILFTVLFVYFSKENLPSFTVLDVTPLTGSPHLAVQIAGWLIAAFAASMIGNVFYYWLHRAQHGIPVLWRFHRVHHSIREMSAISSYHHFTDEMVQYFAVGVPTALLVRVDSGAMPWLIMAVVGTHHLFIHSSMNVNIGPLRYILGDNYFHRIHHSREPRHFGKNFGTSTPLWDVLFGTAYFPKKGEWPAVGLADVPPPKSLRDYFVMPLQNITDDDRRRGAQLAGLDGRPRSAR